MEMNHYLGQYIQLQSALEKAVYSKELNEYVVPVETLKSLRRYVGSHFKKKSESINGWENYDPTKEKVDFEG